MHHLAQSVYIRAAYSPFMVILALTLGVLFVFGPLAGAALILSLVEVEALGEVLVVVVLALFCVGLSIYFCLSLHNNFQWVELDGEYLRGRRLFTRLLVEQRVEDLIKVTTFYSVNAPLNALANALYGDVRGYALEFKAGPGIYVGKQELTDADVLMVAIRRAAPQGVLYSERKPR